MKKITAVCLIVFLALAAAGCASDYRLQSFKQTIFEPYGRTNENIISLNGLTATTGRAVYYGDGVSTTALSKLISAAEKVITLLDLQQKPVFYISKKIGGNYIYNNSVYLNTPDLNECTRRLLQLKYADYSNYGIIYGTAAAIAKKCGFPPPAVISNRKLNKLLASSQANVTDLNYPLFSRQFSDKNTIEGAQALSVKLVRHILDNYGSQALASLLNASAAYDMTFEFKYAFYVNDFLQGSGAEIRYHIPAAVLRYSPLTPTYPLKISSTYSEYLIAGDYKPVAAAYDVDFYGDYNKIKIAFGNLESDIEKVRRFLSDDRHFQQKKIVSYIDHRYESPTADKNGFTHNPDFKSVLRGYTRSLLFDAYNPILWLNGMATYCNFRFNALAANYITAALKPDAEITDEYLAGLTGFDRLLINYYLDNRLLSPLDYLELMAFSYHHGGGFNESISDAGLISYLVATYGEPAFKAAYGDNEGFFYLDGKSEYQLSLEYEAHMEAKYGKYL